MLGANFLFIFVDRPASTKIQVVKKCALKLRSAVLNVSVQQAVVAQASSLHRSVSFLQFACQATGRGVIRASHIRSVKIKPAKISSEESGEIFLKFFTSGNFLLYSIAYTDHAVFLHLIILVFLSACSFFFRAYSSTSNALSGRSMHT